MKDKEREEMEASRQAALELVRGFHKWYREHKAEIEELFEKEDALIWASIFVTIENPLLLLGRKEVKDSTRFALA